MNIRVDLNTPINDGMDLVFRSPVDCSQITGLIVYYKDGNNTCSKEFALADAHGNNVGDIDHLFAENVVVKVILDVTSGMAFVQNADTNAYIEKTFIKSINGKIPDRNGNVEVEVSVTDEQIETAVETYLEENPVGAGIEVSETEPKDKSKLWVDLNDNSSESADAAIVSSVEKYLEENPVEAGATKEEAAQIQQNKEDIEKLNTDKLDADKLTEAVNDALAQAKASGEFDGQDGYTPIKGKDYFDGNDGKTAYQYAKDGGYTGTEAEFSAKLAKELPTKVSELTNDSGYITGYTETDPTVPSWAKAESKPTYSKSEVGLGNVDNVKQYSASNPPPYPVTSINGKSGDVTLDADAVGARPNTWMPTAADVGARPSTWTPTYTDVGADKSGTASSAVSTHNTKTDAHNDIRLLISALTTRLDALANSDDTTLDQMAEVVAYIKANRDLIDQITTGKVSVADIVNNLTTNVSNKPLSAAQGVALKALIDAITVPTTLSQLTDDSTHRTVTDTEKASWNAKSNFSGNYADLSGKPTIPTVPTKVSAFTNDAGYLTEHQDLSGYALKTEIPSVPVKSVNGKTGAVNLTASDVDARPSTWMPSASDVGAVPTTQTITVTGVDADGTTHTWTMYGVKQ